MLGADSGRETACWSTYANDSHSAEDGQRNYAGASAICGGSSPSGGNAVAKRGSRTPLARNSGLIYAKDSEKQRRSLPGAVRNLAVNALRYAMRAERRRVYPYAALLVCS